MFVYFILFIIGALNAICYSNGPLPFQVAPELQIFTLTIFAFCVMISKNAKQAFYYGLSYGVSSFCIGIHWVYVSLNTYGNIPILLAILFTLLFAFYLSLYYGLAAFLYRLTNKETTFFSAFSFAAFWTLCEWLRGTMFTGFPWNNVAYAQITGLLKNWAPILGSYGIAFLASLLAALICVLVIALLTRTWLNIALSLISILTITGISAALAPIEWTHPDRSNKDVAIRLIQPDVPMDEKFSTATSMQSLIETFSLATGTENHRVDLIVFPETTITLFQTQVPPIIWKQIVDISDYTNSSLLIGAPLLHHQDNGEIKLTNGAILVTRDTTSSDLYDLSLPHYSKRHLVPFGEYIPLGFRWFTNLLQIPLGDFNSGDERQQPFMLNGSLIGTSICYENLFGNELRWDVLEGAQILVNISNLAWFGNTIALDQHLAISQMRSLELGRPMVLATNTGKTAYINEKGRIINVLPTETRHFLDVKVTPFSGLTPFAKYGNYPIITLVMILSLISLILMKLLPVSPTSTE